jgi:serine O-acetyltransferase
MASTEPLLADYLDLTIVDRESLIDSLSQLLAGKLASSVLPVQSLIDVFADAFKSSAEILYAIHLDLFATMERDPASNGIANPFLNYKGFHALEAYRATHYLWHSGRRPLAHHLQGRISEVFSADIHPAAIIGNGVFIDHGTSIVIGETAVIGNDVSILQEVTLGGTGKVSGDRHPKIGRGVLLGAGAKVLGNIRVGDGAKVGAGSVVLKDVSPHTTVVGVPAKPVGRPRAYEPALVMEQNFDDDEQLGGKLELQQ